MPLIMNLAQNDQTLDTIAVFRVLAVMCHPTDTKRREAMLARIQLETGQGVPRRKAITNEQFRREVNRHARQGALAGSMLLNRLQLLGNGYRPSVNTGVKLIQYLLPEWKQPYLPSIEDYDEHIPRSRRGILKAIEDYQTVAHLWAAHVHGLEWQRDDIWPGRPATLPIFLAYAEAILDIASSISTPDGPGRTLMSKARAPRFVLPAMIECPYLNPLPFAREMQALIDELRPYKPMM